MNTRTGKIARLPRAIREQLNQRLRDGQSGKELVGWLNSLAEVKTVLAASFRGRPLSEQNLSEWKQGGYREWERQQERAEDMGRLMEQWGGMRDSSGEAAFLERLAEWLTLEMARQMEAMLEHSENPAERWQRLQEAVSRLVQIRREASIAGRLKLEQERWQAKQNAAAAKAQADDVLYPLNAAVLQYGIHQLVANASPQGQAVMLQTLERLGAKRAKAGNSPTTAPPVAGNSIQG